MHIIHQHRNSKRQKLKTKIAILGIGAIGSVIAKELYFNKSLHLDLYNRTNRSVLKVVQGNTTFEKLDVIKSNVDSDHKYELLILCLKEHQVENAITEWNSLISQNTQVLIIRNGINHINQLKGLGINNGIIPAIIDCPTEITKDGYVQLYSAKITIPYLENNDLIKTIFTGSQTTITETNTFHHDAWSKLCLSASLGATQCKHNGTCEIFKSDEVVMYFFELLMESVAIANADGANITNEEIKSILLRVEHYPPEKGSSMFRDYQSGITLELGAKNGAILSVANTLKRTAKRNEEFVMWTRKNTLQ